MAQAPQRNVNPTANRNYAAESLTNANLMDIDDSRDDRSDSLTDGVRINQRVEKNSAANNVGSTFGLLAVVLIAAIAAFYFLGNGINGTTNGSGTVTQQNSSAPAPAVNDSQPNSVNTQPPKVDETAPAPSNTTVAPTTPPASSTTTP
jgi:hypothetical protein